MFAFDLPMPKKRGNPNWGKPAQSVPDTSTEFERKATRTRPHERELCQLGSIADLVGSKQESSLYPGMAAEGIRNAGGSRRQQCSLRTRYDGP
jgi:hypothetical protein